MEPAAWTVKLFLGGDPPPPRAFVPTFHRWIQEGALDEILVDVADYSHVHEGPGVLLVCHEAHYSIDQEGGRPGVLYAKKRGSAADTVEGRVRDALRKALTACRLLEQDEALTPRATFRTDEFLVGVTDRLLAPNTPATFEALRGAIERASKRAFGDVSLEHLRDPKAPFRVRLTTSGVDLATALARVT